MAAVAGRGLRIGTWNVHEGRPVPAEERVTAGDPIDIVAELVREYRLDVLALQEVSFEAGDESAMLAGLREHTELRHIYAEPLSESMYDPALRSGLGIASRIPLHALTFEMLPNPDLTITREGEEKRTFDKGMIAADLIFQGRQLTVASLHSFPFHYFGRDAADPEFDEVWESLAGQIGMLPGELFAIGGDFNTQLRELLLARVERPLRRSFEGVATHRGKELDDLLHSPQLELVGEPISLDSFSDHKLCIVELEPRPADG